MLQSPYEPLEKALLCCLIVVWPWSFKFSLYSRHCSCNVVFTMESCHLGDLVVNYSYWLDISQDPRLTPRTLKSHYLLLAMQLDLNLFFISLIHKMIQPAENWILAVLTVGGCFFCYEIMVWCIRVNWLSQRYSLCGWHSAVSVDSKVVLA